MARMTKWLAGTAAVFALAITGLLVSTNAAHAEPIAPAKFVGTVTVDGTPVPAGTVIEATVNGQSCGVTQTFDVNGEARYAMDVAAQQPEGGAACGGVDLDGSNASTVTFHIGGKMAIETGEWRNYQLNTVNLTYITPTPTTEPTAVSTATTVPTPAPPDTGLGTESSSSGTFGLTVALLGLGVVTFGLGGVAAARRSR